MRFMRRGNKNSNPFMAALVGLAILAGAFIMLWSNEGRVNLAPIAEKSEQVTAAEGNPNMAGTLIGISDRLESDETLGDEGFLRAGPYISLERHVEMYAWTEDSEEEDGETYYDYEMEWTSSPEDSQNFYDTSYQNPAMPYNDQKYIVREATIGAYEIDAMSIELPTGEAVTIKRADVIAEADEITESFIFLGYGSLAQPEIGDLRVSYTAVQNGIQVTAFGESTGNGLAPYDHKGKATLYRVLEGNREQAIDSLETEYKMLLWGFRIFGTVLMWVGLLMVMSPIRSMFAWIPLVGRFAESAISLIALAIALPLALITIIISAIAHNIWLLLTVIVIAGGVTFYFVRRNQVAEKGKG